MIDYKFRNIAFSPPDITDAEIGEVIKAMKSGWITTGPRTKEFEKKIAEYVGTNKAVCLNSATAAMELTLRILGIGPGDEVITSAYTYTASASIIDHVGAKIVLVDTAPDSFEMDYSQLAEAITEKTKAIIPVDIAGKMCDYDTIYEIVESKKELFKANNALQKLFNRVIVMTDAAHAFGAERNGIKCGQVSDFTCYSFHAVKNLTTAEGGAVVWRNDLGLDDEWLYKQFMLYSLHGQSKDALAKTQKGAWEYDIVYPAYKCNMTDIMAGFGLIQLNRYESLMKRRKEIIEMYDKALLPLGIQSLQHYGEDFASSGHLYLTRVSGIGEAERNEIIIKMAEAGVSCNVHYKPLPMFTAYKNLGFDIKDYPNAFDMYKNEITLPLHTLLRDEDVDHVIESYKKIINDILSAGSQVGLKNV
ncbi:DegT/DnrJ/EryC1/StrS family aminotransferase [Peribacillus frigoritolerans]|uniref:DegT/DnrJ/EryC1/StrS family aminotransferase n=1 Tax=Peribacillus frigoritolerans TaxID=450367 RepID=UPI003422A0E6